MKHIIGRINRDKCKRSLVVGVQTHKPISLVVKYVRIYEFRLCCLQRSYKREIPRTNIKLNVCWNNVSEGIYREKWDCIVNLIYVTPSHKMLFIFLRKLIIATVLLRFGALSDLSAAFASFTTWCKIKYLRYVWFCVISCPFAVMCTLWTPVSCPSVCSCVFFVLT